ncbi:MAG: hypothetical protein AB8G11_19570 [Saprospiraceae bacterium]
MKYIILITGIILCLGFQYSDSHKPEIEKLYVQALNNRFDLMPSSGYKYIELNEITSSIKNEISTKSVYKFVSNEELIQIALKRKRPLSVYRMTHKEISKDTIDVNFSYLNLTAKKKIHWNKGLKFNNVEYQLNDNEIKEYEPDFRFVKNIDSQNWEMIKSTF